MIDGPAEKIAADAQRMREIRDGYRARSRMLPFASPEARDLRAKADQADELASQFAELAHAVKGLDPKTDREEWWRRVEAVSRPRDRELRAELGLPVDGEES